jgi:outer membrane protein assembly factor BamE (lipoprotein component of BamABCDE complex)
VKYFPSALLISLFIFSFSIFTYTAETTKQNKVWDTPFGKIKKYSIKKQVKKVLGQPHWENPTHNIWYYYFDDNNRKRQ